MGRGAVGVERVVPDGTAAPADRAAWEVAGLADLTGRPEGPPLGPPPGLVPGLRDLAAALSRDSAILGHAVEVDPLDLLAARAREAGLRRGGAVSCGGSARLLRAVDGWLVVGLPRPTDWELVAAWLGLPSPVDEGDWVTVEAAVALAPAGALLGRSEGLGLPVARVGERRAPPASRVGPDGIAVTSFSPGPPSGDMTELVVADLSAMWAGPLAAALLAASGARVRKVESASRPDGARGGPPAHYASLNAGKAEVVVDLDTAAGRAALLREVQGADVVVTSSRPRALAALGLDPRAVLRQGRPRVWLSVTGYGTRPGSAERVAFGDDAAAAGGLVVDDDRGPCFCADAVADPVTGLAAAAAVLAALRRGGDHLLDASMADVSGSLAGPPPDP